jgi:hypothetical protein
MDQRTHVLFALMIAPLTLILLFSFIAPPQPAQADLPPRPTEIPDTPEPTEEPAAAEPLPGSLIQLEVEFPVDWPWQEIHGRTLWTMVQWQDVQGQWHDVEGWQGALDAITLASDGTAAGTKTWWLGRDNQGTGPFRWQIAVGRDGGVLAVTDPFHLPEVDGQLKTITVSLVAPTVN